MTEETKSWLSALDVKSEYESSNKEIILNYIDNSTLNNNLYDLAREMRRNGSNYWADKLCEKIKK